MTNPVISVVHQRTIKPTILVRLVLCCAIVALLCAPTLGMARDRAGRPGNRPVTPGVVRQAHVEPHTITLPVVDAEGIRFTRLSTDEGLSQTKVSQIVQDNQGFMWFGTQYGLNRYDGYNFKLASKRIAELVLLARAGGATRMKALRLGNVLGSRGSVLPVFLKQILSGRPVTVTHREVQRYFLSTADAVALLLLVLSFQAPEVVLVPELGRPRTVEALARHLIADNCDPAAGAVNSPGLTSAALNKVERELQQACRERSLPRLLAAVLSAVPEYKPSALIVNACGNACDESGLTTV